ncbi:ABC transporter ATP-binding protein [Paenibacillus kobensis]|uniref:ABC transporter ATP-binding protein n=1 Tax=Paenibacillus kobensis TaxID=59841 RepID=UPI0013E3C46C|nr:ABC transporter ATP-binding protein [Paenibacillus kobensis]
MSHAPALQVKGLTKQRQGRMIVEDVSFTLMKGEIFGLIGENGAGKTTTLGMIASLIRPTAGSVSIGGFSLEKRRKEALRELGAIIEGPALYKYFRGIDQLNYLCGLYGRHGKKQQLDDVIELMGMSDYVYKRIGQYSLGMRQRLAIAQCLLNEPSLLILDEPLNGLDPGGVIDFRQLIGRIAKEKGLAVVISSHQLSEVEQICDRFGLLHDKKLSLIGTPSAQVHRDAVLSFAVEFEQRDQAYALLTAQSYIHDVTRQGENVLTFLMEREHYPALLALLGGLPVKSIREKAFDLESEYLRMTRNKQSG